MATITRLQLIDYQQIRRLALVHLPLQEQALALTTEGLHEVYQELGLRRPNMALHTQFGLCCSPICPLLT